MRPLLWGMLAALLFSPPARADWPHLRGPNYDAVSTETGLVEAWPEGGPPALWTRELGQGYSGFVAAGERVFTQTQTQVAQYVLCLDAATGAEVWRRRVDWPWQPAGAYPGPYATPTWHDNRVYYSTPTGTVGCLDADTGASRWSVELTRKYKSKGTGFGYASTPLVEDGRVIVPVGGKGASVVALDARDGSTLWASGDDPASYCPAYPITLGGQRTIVAYLQNSLVGHDPATGERLWRVEVSSEYDEHSAWPIYSEPYLMVSAPFRAGARLYRLGGDTPKPVWHSEKLSNDVCSSVLFAGHVYGFDLHQLQASAHRASRGRFKCLEFATGQVKWETDKVGQATAIVADGKLILLNDTGTLVLVRVNPVKYEQLARAKVLPGVCWTPPTLHRHRLYLRDQTRAVCVYLGRPEELAPDQAAAPITQPPLEFDRAWLLPREPDYPHDAPGPADVARWFAACLAVFGVAAVFATAVGLAARLRRVKRVRLWMSVAFTASAFALGLAGTTLLSGWLDTFLLTWPASLYVAFRLTLGVITWAEGRADKRRPRLVSRLVTLAFLALCFGYYHLCFAVGYVVAWSFLAGFLPAAPLTIVAAKARQPWGALADVAAFGVYFWTSGLLPGWKETWAG